jgi:uncharacterized protein YdhG (YjbR/CyaY superfamily)
MGAASTASAASTEIDADLATLPPPLAAALGRLRKEIRRALPEAVACISYRMPAFRRPRPK